MVNISRIEKSPTLCLNMIVKNESKIITRLFDSVISIIDSYCICDTGSTDDTVNIITSFFNDKNIPGKVVTEPFKNFCHNRNFAMTSCFGMSDYILLLDADMVFEISGFDKSQLNGFDSFNILQGNDSFYYQNMRIIKNNGQYKYNGVTHEYIDTPDNNAVYNFKKSELFIRDLGDGGCKQNKYERDIQLLLNGIADDPNNARYYFYLANSYHDVGKYVDSISAYKKRIDLGGWVQEVWYSHYRIGICLKHLGKIDEAINYWLKGFYYYPERLEGLYEIMYHCRVTSQHYLCNEIYKKAKPILDLDKNRDDYLFLHNDVYTYKIYYEFTIISGYVGINNINYEIVKMLNNARNDNEVNNLLSNIKFNKDILTQKSKVIFNDSCLKNINSEEITLTSSSSCLIHNTKSRGYQMNVRYVNYYINNGGCYLNCDKNIITLNKYIELDKDFTITKDKWFDVKFTNRRYEGIEDVRIYNDTETNEITYIGTGYHNNDTLGIVTGNYDTNSSTFNVNEITQAFNNSQCEKNWVFVEFNNSTHVVYDWHPMNICKINKTTNSLEKITARDMPLIFSKVRGSTCGFKFTTINNKLGEFWFVNHIVSYETPRHYYHIISVFDSNMKLLRYSAPFKFEGEAIEYCLSIVVENDRVLMNYSTWDRTTIIGVYDKHYIDSVLKYT